MPTKAASSVLTQCLLAVVLVTLAVIAAIIVVFITRPDHDNSGIITTICSVAAPTVFALIAIIKSQANSEDIQLNTSLTAQAAADAKKAAIVVDSVKEDVRSVKSEVSEAKVLAADNAERIEVIHKATNSLVAKTEEAANAAGNLQGRKDEDKEFPKGRQPNCP